MEGYNGSVLLYGQTGTGKTHTMSGTEDLDGVLQLAVNDIFGRLPDGWTVRKSHNRTTSPFAKWLAKKS